MTPEYVIVLTTLPAGAENDAFGRTLVEERLAACVNLLPPMESVYRWEGQVERDTERQVIIKTARDRVAALWDRIRELHPYETPEFVVLTISDGSEAYLQVDWGVDDLITPNLQVPKAKALPTSNSQTNSQMSWEDCELGVGSALAFGSWELVIDRSLSRAPASGPR